MREMDTAVSVLHVTRETDNIAFMPHVTPEMASAEYWISKTQDPDLVLADSEQINALNKDIVGVPDCHLRDMADLSIFQKNLVDEARSELSLFIGGDNFVASGDPFSENEMDEILRNIVNDKTDWAAILDETVRKTIDAGSIRNIEDDEASTGPIPLYGICTKITDVRIGPTDMIVTDSLGDLDFDQLQLDSLRINDPVIIRAKSADGRFIYCDAATMSGWVPAEDIAVCRDQEEWLGAWNIADEDVIVVTQGKILLDESNVNPDSSGRILSMGCVLRRVRPEDYDASVTNRASFYNYAVYLPVRKSDGSYARTIALIPMHSGVRAGYLPLTVRNILTVAFSRIGDAYGWGGMLSTPDCSAYTREIYRCFGLVLPRNSLWQMNIPARKWSMDSWSDEKKQELLDTLKPGALLSFKGHIMLYLGESGGRHYVINATSRILDPQTGDKVRVRGIVVNSLEDSYRPNGKGWLEDLYMAVVPYRAVE